MRRLVDIMLVFFVATVVMSTSCRRSTDATQTDSICYNLPDTIVVGTLYSPTSYFLYKGDLMGYNYDMMNRFAADKHIAVRFEVFRSLSAMLEELDSARIDVAAYNVPITAEYKSRVLSCGPENVTTQVLIQPLEKGKAAISDVTQLVGKDVYVEKDSKYESRLRNLNNEVGGGINIHTIARDTLMSEDLIEMVAGGEISLTIVDSDIAQLDHSYFPNIDIRLEVSFPQRSAWAVSLTNSWLADSINAWAGTDAAKAYERNRYDHYYTSRMTKAVEYKYSHRRGEISPFDAYFKEAAKLIGWDWRLLAAQGYVESKFDPNAVSWAGARGIMQMMPGTARRYGLEGDQIVDPQACINAAARSIVDLDKMLVKYVSDPVERQRFVLAAYNSGIAHIFDAIALAKKYGKNPQVWYANVSDALLMKANPEYYNDEVCKYGYFRGRQTVNYVVEVERNYQKFCK